MLKTQNDLKSNVKKSVCAILNDRLADLIDLALVTKQAHWNLRGPLFIGVHELLDTFRETLDGHVDTVAERIAQLGGTANGTVQGVSAASKLKAYPLGIIAVEDHLKALTERYAVCANAVRESIDAADELGDAGTTDIFTAASRDLDKALWMLEAHHTPA